MQTLKFKALPKMHFLLLSVLLSVGSNGHSRSWLVVDFHPSCLFLFLEVCCVVIMIDSSEKCICHLSLEPQVGMLLNAADRIQLINQKDMQAWRHKMLT